MATGQGTTWVLVADAHRARVLSVEDAGLPARLVSTLQAPVWTTSISFPGLFRSGYRSSFRSVIYNARFFPYKVIMGVDPFVRPWPKKCYYHAPADKVSR